MRRVLLLGGLTLLGYGCVSEEAPTPESTQEPTVVLSGEINEEDANSLTVAFTLPESMPVRLTCDEVGGTQEQHQRVLQGAKDQRVTMRGLKPDTEYECVARSVDGAISWSQILQVRTPRLPPDLVPPVITVPSSDVAQTGYTLYNHGVLLPAWQYTSAYLMILDAEGVVRWYLRGPAPGDVDATYLGQDKLIYGGEATLAYPPTIIGLDRSVDFLATSEPASPWEIGGAYNHDAGVSELGDSVFTIVHTLHDNLWRGFVLKEIGLDNEVRWSWDSELDGVAQGALPDGSAQDWDPYHANTVDDVWEDGSLKLYVSLRNKHRILKIDYDSGLVEWQLGVGQDFTLLEADGSVAADHRWFFAQHDIKRIGNSFLIYDNGDTRWNYGGEYFSRALRLEVDEKARVARIAWEYTETDWYEPVWGGMDWLPNGNYLIAMGHCNNCGSPDHHSALVEVNPAGQVVWRAQYEDLRVAFYRADRIDGCAIFANTRYCPELKGD